MKRFARGFTLIELVVVVAIVGILASAVFPVADLVAHRAREEELRVALRQIRDAIDAYKRAADAGLIEKAADANGYPKTLDDLVMGVANKKQPDKQAIYFLRRLPRDPMNPDVSASPAASWATRAYASPPDDPEEGDDVFDVHSRSTKPGLNGVAYSEW